MIGTPSSLTSAMTSLRKPRGVGERRARLVDAGVDRPAEVLEERAEQPAVQLGAVAGAD